MIDKLILIAVLLLAWGFFAGSESAFISVSRIKLSEQRKRGGRGASVAHILLRKPERLLSTVLIGTNLSLVLAANLVAVVVADLFGEPKPMVSIVVITLVSLIVSEIIPKNYGIRHNLRVTVLSAIPMFVFYVIFYPVGMIFTFFTKVIIRAAGVSYTGLAPSLFSKKEDLKIFLKSSLREPFTRDQRRYFLDSLDFSQKALADIMIPLIDMQALRVDEKVGSCHKFVKTKKKFYIPVYKERIDNIVGLIYARDIFDIDRSIPLALIMREPYFVPERKNINELYRELYEKDIPVVFAVDEHGGVTGMATVYDLGEEVIGRISTLENQRELIIKVREGEFLCDGEVEIDELNYLLSVEMRFTDVTTLNGLLLTSLGRIPKKGDILEQQGYRFVVEKSSRKRAELVRIVKKAFD